jgi:cytochrome P450
MYFAGHDTTAAVLAVALCLLAVHKREQRIVLEEAREVSNETVDGNLEFEHYDSLVMTRSAFVEALRMYPAGSVMLRETREDTVIQVPCGTDADGKVMEEHVPIPKGTVIIGDTVGMRKFSSS